MIANSSIPQWKMGNQSSSQEPCRCSASPDHHNTRKQPPTDRSSGSKKPVFHTGTSRRVYSACAICLSCHPHKIIDCNAPTLWDKSLHSCSLNKQSSLDARWTTNLCRLATSRQLHQFLLIRFKIA